jgi:hypothetical protein
MNQLQSAETSTLLEFFLNVEDHLHHRLFDPLAELFGFDLNPQVDPAIEPPLVNFSRQDSES